MRKYLNKYFMNNCVTRHKHQTLRVCNCLDYSDNKLYSGHLSHFSYEQLCEYCRHDSLKLTVIWS